MGDWDRDTTTDQVLAGLDLSGRRMVVTGASGGLGEETARALAAAGASVVMAARNPAKNEEAAGRIRDRHPSADLELRELDLGSLAAVRDFAGGFLADHDGLHVLINNAGILRDRMVFSMSESDWDAVVNVHLKGTFAPTLHAAAYWREKVKAGGDAFGRIINTSSPSGIYGNVGQANYGAAKAGIAAFTIITAMELVKYGVTVNCLAPGAYTRMTADLGGFDSMDEEAQEAMSPRWIAVPAVWLCSEAAQNVTGRVFDVRGEQLGVAEQWNLGPSATQPDDPADLTDVMAGLLADARLNSGMHGHPTEGPGRPGPGL